MGTGELFPDIPLSLFPCPFDIVRWYAATTRTGTGDLAVPVLVETEEHQVVLHVLREHDGGGTSEEDSADDEGEFFMNGSCGER